MPGFKSTNDKLLCPHRKAIKVQIPFNKGLDLFSVGPEERRKTTGLWEGRQILAERKNQMIIAAL